MLRKWEVQPGLGEAILAGIGNDVNRRRQIGPSIPTMELVAQANIQTADILLARQTQRTRVPFDMDHESPLSDYAARLTQRQLQAALDLRKLIEEAREIEEREHWGQGHPHFRVRIKALEPDAVGWRKSGSAGGSPTKGKQEILEPGEARTGRSGSIGSIASAPHLGGQLLMDFEGMNPLRKGIYVTGLVSPDTGEPQVDLQILTKV